MTVDEFKIELNTVKINEISIGYSRIYIYRVDELEEAQSGYSVDSEGNSLIGNDDGDWRPSWLVIGYDELCGDPIFIDLACANPPVFTAIVVDGKWSESKIADDFLHFIQNLDLISEIARGRENPVLLGKNPMTVVQVTQVINHIKSLNPGSDIVFWELLLRSTSETTGSPSN